MKKIITYFFLLLLCPGLRAQNIANWTFENIRSAVPSTPIEASSYSWKVDGAYAYISGGNNNGSPDVCSGAETWSTNFWPTSSSRSSGDYLEFEAIAKEGYDLVVSEFVFSSNISSADGARKFDVYYSIDGHSEEYLGSGSNSFSFCSQHAYSLSAHTLSGGRIGFRIYPYQQDPAAMAASMRLDNVSIRGEALLPVNLIEWKGEVREEGILLIWSTSNEQSNAYFSIERSADSLDFEEIERLSGRGESQQITEYVFLDVSPASGNNYYRLKQVDWDETAQYSDIINLHYTPKTSIQVYPTLVKDLLNMDLRRLKEEAVTVSIHRLSGGQVFQRAYTFPLDLQQINMEGWESGMYVLMVQTERERVVRRFMKH